jgi:replicative DNA helicase
MGDVADDLYSAGEALDLADGALRRDQRAAARVIPTGFPLLDTYLGGGLRGGELILLGGPQGLGKTAFVLQIARHAAAIDEAAVVLSYEHDGSTLLERLVTVEAGDTCGLEGVPLRKVREALEGGGPRGASLEERLVGTTGGPEAVGALRLYAERLLLHRSSGAVTGLEEIAAVVQGAISRSGRRPVVVVDYLQKVFVRGRAPEDERITEIVAGLKDIALAYDVPVLAVAAADAEGIAPGRRLRVNHLRGSAILAYEPDVVLIMNEKVDVVARRHLVYDTRAADRYRAYVVLSIEKNRSGLSQIDLELRKRLEQSRFERGAHLVEEELVDERIFTE